MTTATFDKNSNPLTLVDPLRQTTTFGHDALDRLTALTFTGAATGTTATANVAYAYDDDGHRTSMTDGNGTGTSAYDELGRPTSVTSQGPGGAKTVGYRYDKDGHRTKVIYPDATAVTYAYDGAGRLAS